MNIYFAHTALLTPYHKTFKSIEYEKSYHYNFCSLFFERSYSFLTTCTHHQVVNVEKQLQFIQRCFWITAKILIGIQMV